MFYVYILKSIKDDYCYTGFSGNLKQRFEYHDSGKNRSTRSHIPLRLIYYEAYINESDARKRERFLKAGRGREIIKNQIKNSLRV